MLPGDGIGQEVTAEARARARRRRPRQAGTRLRVRGGPDRRRRHRRRRARRCRPRRCELCRQAPRHPVRGGRRAQVGPPAAGAARPSGASWRIRKELDLYANLRPATCFPMLVDASPLKRSVVEGTDIMVIRELTGGLYFGEPRGVEALRRRRRARASTRWRTPSREIERIARAGLRRGAQAPQAPDLGGQVQRAGGVAAVAGGRHARGPKDIPTCSSTTCWWTTAPWPWCTEPTHFDTIVTENTFGDILSDEAAILAGSMGMLPSASLGASGTGGALRAGARHRAGHRRARGSPTRSRPSCRRRCCCATRSTGPPTPIAWSRP